MLVQQISIQMARQIVKSASIEKEEDTYWRYHPRGLFYFCETMPADGKILWVAMDNSTGECFMEAFGGKGAAVEWLKMCDPDRDGYESFFNAADICDPSVFEDTYLATLARSHPEYCPQCLSSCHVRLRVIEQNIEIGKSVDVQCPNCGYKMKYTLGPKGDD